MNENIIASIFATGLLVSAGGSPAMAASSFFSGCTLPKSILSTSRLTDIPPVILEQMPGLGAADGPIRTDNPMSNDTRPRIRLAEAFSQRNRWAIVYETGGFSNARMVAIFTLSADKKRAKFIGPQTGPFAQGVCAILHDTFPNKSN